jgi:hypothetical protein
MSLKNRVKNLEIRSGTDEGLMYFVLVADGIYTLKANGADILENVEMSESEFAEWENTRGENDCIFVISRRED